MYTISQNQYQLEAEPIFQRVFITDNPLANEIFSPAMKARIIFFALTQQIEIPIMDAVVASATNLGDSGCYISLTESHLQNNGSTAQLITVTFPSQNFLSLNSISLN